MLKPCRAWWYLSAVVTLAGLVLTAYHFHHDDDPWLFLGMTLIVAGIGIGNTGYIARRTRTLDEEFDAGHRVGFRAGRRAGKPVVVYRQFGEGSSARVQETSFRPVAGHREAARRSQEDEDGPAEGCR